MDNFFCSTAFLVVVLEVFGLTVFLEELETVDLAPLRVDDDKVEVVEADEGLRAPFGLLVLMLVEFLLSAEIILLLFFKLSISLVEEDDIDLVLVNDIVEVDVDEIVVKETGLGPLDMRLVVGTEHRLLDLDKVFGRKEPTLLLLSLAPPLRFLRIRAEELVKPDLAVSSLLLSPLYIDDTLDLGVVFVKDDFLEETGCGIFDFIRINSCSLASIFSFN